MKPNYIHIPKLHYFLVEMIVEQGLYIPNPDGSFKIDFQCPNQKVVWLGSCNSDNASIAAIFEQSLVNACLLPAVKESDGNNWFGIYVTNFGFTSAMFLISKKEGPKILLDQAPRDYVITIGKVIKDYMKKIGIYE